MALVTGVQLPLELLERGREPGALTVVDEEHING